MIDTELNKFLKPTLNKIAKLLIKFGFKANFVTFAGFFFGLCCFYFIINSLFLLAIIFLFLNRLFDGLDGAIARLNGETDIGAFYDIILDFIFYSLFPIAFIFLDLNYSYSICFLLLSFVATQTTFLASAWIIEKNKISISDGHKKSFFYSGGITEGFETIICFTLMLLFHEFIDYIAYIFGVLCWITFFCRIIFVKKILSSKNNII
ncbi:MAG: CDP-alcohol phosphatidyltransferase family protein [Candidatus Puniceispirillales bacterium]